MILLKDVITLSKTNSKEAYKKHNSSLGVNAQIDIKLKV